MLNIFGQQFILNSHSKFIIMKTTLLMIVGITTSILFFPSAVAAQFTKGDWLTEGGIGNINVSNTKNQFEQSGISWKNEANSFTSALFPRLGYFLNRNFLIGTTLGLEFDSEKTK